MDKVMASFRIIEIVEVIVIVAGLVLVLFRRRGSRLRAAGIGCMAQGSIMLVLDLFAEAHGRDYLTALARLW